MPILDKDQQSFMDNEKINLSSDFELHYWATVLKSNPNDLKDAVKKVGNEVSNVKKLLYPDYDIYGENQR